MAKQELQGYTTIGQVKSALDGVATLSKDVGDVKDDLYGSEGAKYTDGEIVHGWTGSSGTTWTSTDATQYDLFVVAVKENDIIHFTTHATQSCFVFVLTSKSTPVVGETIPFANVSVQYGSSSLEKSFNASKRFTFTNGKEFYLKVPSGVNYIYFSKKVLGGEGTPIEFDVNGDDSPKSNPKFVAIEGNDTIKIWKGTQAEYDALSTHNSSTIYFIV